jgi:Metallopeptidase toxin 3
MRIDSSLTNNFPKVAQWIKEEIPKCLRETRILSPFLKYSQLSLSEAQIALSDNQLPPTIDVAIMLSDGQYRPRFARNRNKIFISKKLCREFQKLDWDYLVNKPYDLIMKATILHEMIHWGDYIKDQIRQPNRDIYDNVHEKWLRNKDVGFQFEVEAFYGIYTKEYLH